jgi:hypothetical protein
MPRAFSKPQSSRADPSVDPESSRPGAPASESPFAAGARVRALLRGVERAEQDLKDSGGALDLDQVRALLRGVTRQSVEKRVREGSLLAVPGPGGRRYYPAVQFDDGGSTVPGMREVLAALPTRNGYAILNFLIRPDARLDNRRPIDLMKVGELDIVVKAARAMGDAGA